MDLSVVGISHHTAPVEAREAFALEGDLPSKLLAKLRADGTFQEALVLDTCNRTEVYAVARGCDDPVGYLLGVLAQLKGRPSVGDRAPFYQYRDTAAVEHLFRVAAALDSQIVGEHQILGQVKNAYRFACEHRTTQLLLNKLLHASFRAGKRAQTETGLGQGSVSVAQAAVALAMQVFASLGGKSVLVVGAGETATLAAKALVRCGVGRVVVANRTLETGRAIAEEIVRLSPRDALELDLEDATITCPALRQMMREMAQMEQAGQRPPTETRAVGLDEIPALIGAVDLVISSTGAPGLVLTAEALQKPLRDSGRPVVMIDIAVPRDIDPQLGKIDNVFVYNIDHLDRIVAQNLAARQGEIPRVEAIVAEEVRQFMQWYDSLQVTPTIKLLQQRFAQVQAAELAKFRGKLSQADGEALALATRGLCNTIMHQPIAYLRKLSREASPSETLAAANMIREMFALDELEEQDS